jgi:hypothetical protein
MVRYAVSIYTFPALPSKGHSFLLGNYHGGLTDVLQELDFNELRITFSRLRPLIEQKNDGVMTRRTILFQELQHICRISPNPHGRDDRTRFRQYRFGFYPKPEEGKAEASSSRGRSRRGGQDGAAAGRRGGAEQGDQARPRLIRAGEESELNVHQFMRKHSDDGRIVPVFI